MVERGFRRKNFRNNWVCSHGWLGFGNGGQERSRDCPRVTHTDTDGARTKLGPVFFLPCHISGPPLPSAHFKARTLGIMYIVWGFMNTAVLKCVTCIPRWCVKMRDCSIFRLILFCLETWRTCQTELIRPLQGCVVFCFLRSLHCFQEHE